MAKNSQIYSANNPYGNRDEEIRKAKGNPNKNIHAKKKNSNYGGYNGAAEKAHKAAEEKLTQVSYEVFGKVYQQQAAQNQQAGAQPGADAGNAGASNDGTVETDYQVHDDK